VADFPDDMRLQTIYAYWASKCGQWEVADAKFKFLGNRAQASVFDNNPEEMEKTRERVGRKSHPE
jgi:hypothetical protein